MKEENASVITLFLSGDLMTGRGIDQVLPHSCSPRIEEPCLKDARGYVDLAERRNGPISRPLSYRDLWGEALPALERMSPAARIVNLETAITTSETLWPGKGINYRMHPANVELLTEAEIDVAVLANNHILDWGHEGLAETMAVLQRSGIECPGAGLDRRTATAPARVDLAPGERILVFAGGVSSSGIPPGWAAQSRRPGVNLLSSLVEPIADHIAENVLQAKRPGDIAVYSIHWGGNWGFAIPDEQRVFAHRLIDRAGIDIIHGHSSHHVQGIEIYRGKLILYGCGDLVSDYEGIAGHEGYRSDLGLLYFPKIDSTSGCLRALNLVPTRMRNFRLHRALGGDLQWLVDTLNRESWGTGGKFVEKPDATLTLDLSMA